VDGNKAILILGVLFICFGFLKDEVMLDLRYLSLVS
jgi:hypothetical protein